MNLSSGLFIYKDDLVLFLMWLLRKLVILPNELTECYWLIERLSPIAAPLPAPSHFKLRVLVCTLLAVTCTTCFHTGFLDYGARNTIAPFTGWNFWDKYGCNSHNSIFCFCGCKSKIFFLLFGLLKMHKSHKDKLYLWAQKELLAIGHSLDILWPICEINNL